MQHRQLSHEDHKPGHTKYPLSILADNITLSKNVGALFRLCDALGVEHLYLASDTAPALDAKFSKVSRFSERHVAFSSVQEPLQTITQLRQKGYTIISLELTSHSTSIREFDFRAIEKVCLIIGNEAKGINNDLLQASDHCIHIPMLGMNSSMNVINAAAIAIFEISRHLS